VKNIIKFYVDAGLSREDAEMLFKYTNANLTEFKKLVAEWQTGQTQGAGGSSRT